MAKDADGLNNIAVAGPEVIKLFSSSTRLSMEFELLIIHEITKFGCNFMFRLPKPVINPANKC